MQAPPPPPLPGSPSDSQSSLSPESSGRQVILGEGGSESLTEDQKITAYLYLGVEKLPKEQADLGGALCKREK